MGAKELSELLADSLLPVTVIFVILAVFGLFSNAYVFYVYKYNYSKCNFRTFVLCLALVDFFSCVFVFPSEIIGHRIWFSYPPSAAWFCKAKTVLSGADVFTSSFVLLLISVDRFKKVCRPFGKQMKVKTAFRLCLMIFGVGSIIVIPCPILFGIQTTNITYDGNDFEITSCMKDDAYKDTAWLTIYVAIFYYTPIVVFMVTTMILYAKMIRKIFFGSFLQFDKSLSYINKTLKVSDENVQGTSGKDTGLSDNDINHDSDEDNTENDISDEGNTELEKIDSLSSSEQNDPCDNKQINDEAQERSDCINTKAERNIITFENSAPNTNRDEGFENTMKTGGPLDGATWEKRGKEKSEYSKEKDTKYRDAEKMNQTTPKGKRNDFCEDLVNIEGEQIVANNVFDHSHRICKDVLSETKLVQHSCGSLEKNIPERKRKIGTGTFRRLKSQRLFRKRNIKTRSLIMFVVTLIFTITTSIYFCIFTVVYRKEHVLDVVSPDFAAIFFFCWRIYFVNHVINPFVYGFLDPRFRKAIKSSSRKLYRRVSEFALSFRQTLYL